MKKTRNRLFFILEELEKLNCTDISHSKLRVSMSMVDQAFFQIFMAGIKQLSFTEEEKELFGFRVASALSLILINIHSSPFVYRNRSINYVLKKRSAIQFLIEDYGQFPAEKSSTLTLAEVFEKAEICESVRLLEDLIYKKFLFSTKESEDEDMDEEVMTGYNQVPRSHVWWSKTSIPKSWKPIAWCRVKVPWDRLLDKK